MDFYPITYQDDVKGIDSDDLENLYYDKFYWQDVISFNPVYYARGVWYLGAKGNTVTLFGKWIDAWNSIPPDYDPILCYKYIVAPTLGQFIYNKSLAFAYHVYDTYIKSNLYKNLGNYSFEGIISIHEFKNLLSGLKAKSIITGELETLTNTSIEFPSLHEGPWEYWALAEISLYLNPYTLHLEGVLKNRSNPYGRYVRYREVFTIESLQTFILDTQGIYHRMMFDAYIESRYDIRSPLYMDSVYQENICLEIIRTGYSRDRHVYVHYISSDEPSPVFDKNLWPDDYWLDPKRFNVCP